MKYDIEMPANSETLEIDSEGWHRFDRNTQRNKTKTSWIYLTMPDGTDIQRKLYRDENGAMFFKNIYTNENTYILYLENDSDL